MNTHSVSPSRIVHCADAITWLEGAPVVPGTSFVASLPDISEFPSFTLAEWRAWFIRTAALIFSRTPPDEVTVFFQSDIKYEGQWIDKGYLCARAAEEAGAVLLWHKIAARIAPGQTSFGRPGYSHILCFSKEHRTIVKHATPDILPDLGEKIWVRGMGLAACLLIARAIKQETISTTVINPFCGHGSMLAAANHVGLDAIGIERSKKRAALAEQLQVHSAGNSWMRIQRERPL